MKRLLATLLALALLLCGMATLAEGATPDEVTVYGCLGDEAVEEQVVYDAQGIKFTVTGLEIVRCAPALELRIEDASGRRLGFTLAESVLNGWMWDASLCTQGRHRGDRVIARA